MVAQQVNQQIETMLKQAEQLANTHEWSGAADICQKAVANAPENITILDKLGWYLSRSKRYDEAIKIYEKLSELEPKMAKWFYMVGYQYYDQKQWQNAITWFDQSLLRYENYLKALYRKGYAHTQLNENEAAKDAFQKCINVWKTLNDQDKEKEKSSYSDSCFQLGKQYLSEGLTQKAELVLEEAVKYDFQDANKFYEYGKALLKNKKAEKALIQLQKASQIEPRKDYINAYMAQALFDLSRIEEADKALARIPERQRKEYIWRLVGKVKLAQGKNKEAVDALNRGIRLDPKNHNAYFQLGLSHVASDDYSQAYRAFSQAISVRKSEYNLDFPEAKQKLSEIEEYAKSNNINLASPPAKAAEMPMGTITKYNNERGFGFIKRTNGEADLFFHISGVKNPDEIQIGKGVNFVVEDSPKGPRAINITFVNNI